MGFHDARKLLCLLIALIIASFASFVKCEPKVKMLHVVFRHGEKVPHAPFQGYPNDPYGNHSYYPIANGGLTNKGKMSEYKIGKMLRDRYDDFFGPLYWPDEIYARSSDIPRAQMSLQLVFAALFPPVDQQIWNPSLAWQPATVVYEPELKDYLFFPQNCPLPDMAVDRVIRSYLNRRPDYARKISLVAIITLLEFAPSSVVTFAEGYKVEYRNYLEREDIRRLIDEHNSTYEYLTKHTGKSVNTPKAVYYLYNLFREEKMQNLTLPEWTAKVYPDPMKDITILDFNLRSGTTRLKRLGGGIMLRKITEDMKSLCGKTLCPANRKAFFFSGHEDNVARLVRTLGTNDPLLPDYGSTIIIETLQDHEKNDAYFVRVLLWPGSANERLIVQKIPGCSEICPLGDFLGLLKDVIPDEYENQCCVKSKNSKKNSGSSKIFISITASLTIIISLYSGLIKYV